MNKQIEEEQEMKPGKRVSYIGGGIVIVSLLGFLLAAFLRGTEVGHTRLFPKDQTYHFETLRALGYASSGGADINEVLYTIGLIEAGNPESWYREWMALATRVENVGEHYTYDQQGKGNALLKASNYYRTAEFMLYPEDPRKKDTYHKSIAAYYGGLDVLDVTYEQIQVPYQNSHLDALFFPGDLSKHGRTLICVVNGYDSIKEETYFVLGKAALERGFAFLSYDGPGQGSAIRERNIHLTHEWGPVNQQVLDSVLEQHPEIEEIVLVGWSVGSVLATKAAAMEPRISMLVHYDIMYDFSLAIGEDLPAQFREVIFSEGPLPPYVSKSLELTMKFSSEQDWALRHGAWIMGADGDYAKVMNRYRYFEISEDAAHIHIPVLLLVGENDHFVPEHLASLTEAALTQAESITTITYDAASGGSEHCQTGAMSRWNADFFEWVFAHLEQ